MGDAVAADEMKYVYSLMRYSFRLKENKTDILQLF